MYLDWMESGISKVFGRSVEKGNTENLIAFRLTNGYNVNGERKIHMQKKTSDYDNVLKQ